MRYQRPPATNASAPMKKQSSDGNAFHAETKIERLDDYPTTTQTHGNKSKGKSAALSPSPPSHDLNSSDPEHLFTSSHVGYFLFRFAHWYVKDTDRRRIQQEVLAQAHMRDNWLLLWLKERWTHWVSLAQIPFLFAQPTSGSNARETEPSRIRASRVVQTMASRWRHRLPIALLDSGGSKCWFGGSGFPFVSDIWRRGALWMVATCREEEGRLESRGGLDAFGCRVAPFDAPFSEVVQKTPVACHKTAKTPFLVWSGLLTSYLSHIIPEDWLISQAPGDAWSVKLSSNQSQSFRFQAPPSCSFLDDAERCAALWEIGFMGDPSLSAHTGTYPHLPAARSRNQVNPWGALQRAPTLDEHTSLQALHIVLAVLEAAMMRWCTGEDQDPTRPCPSTVEWGISAEEAIVPGLAHLFRTEVQRIGLMDSVELLHRPTIPQLRHSLQSPRIRAYAEVAPLYLGILTKGLQIEAWCRGVHLQNGGACPVTHQPAYRWFALERLLVCVRTLLSIHRTDLPIEDVPAVLGPPCQWEASLPFDCITSALDLLLGLIFEHLQEGNHTPVHPCPLFPLNRPLPVEVLQGRGLSTRPCGLLPSDWGRMLFCDWISFLHRHEVLTSPRHTTVVRLESIYQTLHRWFGKDKEDPNRTSHGHHGATRDHNYHKDLKDDFILLPVARLLREVRWFLIFLHSVFHPNRHPVLQGTKHPAATDACRRRYELCQEFRALCDWNNPLPLNPPGDVGWESSFTAATGNHWAQFETVRPSHIFALRRIHDLLSDSSIVPSIAMFISLHNETLLRRKQVDSIIPERIDIEALQYNESVRERENTKPVEYSTRSNVPARRMEPAAAVHTLPCSSHRARVQLWLGQRESVRVYPTLFFRTNHEPADRDETWFRRSCCVVAVDVDAVLGGATSPHSVLRPSCQLLVPVRIRTSTCPPDGRNLPEWSQLSRPLYDPHEGSPIALSVDGIFPSLLSVFRWGIERRHAQALKWRWEAQLRCVIVPDGIATADSHPDRGHGSSSTQGPAAAGVSASKVEPAVVHHRGCLFCHRTDPSVVLEEVGMKLSTNVNNNKNSGGTLYPSMGCWCCMQCAQSRFGVVQWDPSEDTQRESSGGAGVIRFRSIPCLDCGRPLQPLHFNPRGSDLPPCDRCGAWRDLLLENKPQCSNSNTCSMWQCTHCRTTNASVVTSRHNARGNVTLFEAFLTLLKEQARALVYTAGNQRPKQFCSCCIICPPPPMWLVALALSFSQKSNVVVLIFLLLSIVCGMQWLAL